MKANDKLKFMAYLLSTDPDLNQNGKITQQMIADIFHVSQGTISNWIDDVKMNSKKHTCVIRQASCSENSMI